MIDFAAELVFQPWKLTRNRIQHVINAASPDTYPNREQLKYLLTIQVPDYSGSNTYVDLVTIPNREKPPVVEGITSRYDGASFVFDSLLDGLLKRNKPSYRQSTIGATSQLTTPFRLIETVQYNGSTAYTNNLVPTWCFKMGLTESDFDQWGTRFTSTYQSSARQFLTWQPNFKRVTPTQEEYLYFLLNFTPTPSTVKLRVKAVYTDATEQLLTPLSLSGVQLGQVVCVPVGVYILGANPLKKLQSYHVWLSNENDERLSEVRTYFVEYRTFSQSRGLLFSNSFNCFDTLHLTGVSTESLQAKRYAAYREKPLFLASDFTEFYVVERSGTRELTVSTGFFERNVSEQLRYLDELLLTEECYLITDRNHEPLELLTNTIVDHNDNPDLVARQFVFRFVREQKSHSRLPISPPFESRPTYWKANGIVQVLDGYGKRTGFVRPVKIVKTYVDDDTAVIPYTVKPNTVGDPDYVDSYFDSAVVIGYTPFPNAAITRNTTFNRQGCGVGYMGGPATIIIPAGKYGGESLGFADSLAEAEYSSLNNQEYANTNGVCQLNYQSAAISRASTFKKQGCAAPNVGGSWTITVPAGAYTSTISQADADAGANAYANTLDTQANANLYGSCIGPEFYTTSFSSGNANYRFYITKGSNWIIFGGGYSSGNITMNTNYDIQRPQPLNPSPIYLACEHSVNFSFSWQIFKNGTIINSGTATFSTSTGVWLNVFQVPEGIPGDMFYVKVF